MRVRLLTALVLATATLAGCATPSGPVANCFALVEGGAPCDFQPVPGSEGHGYGAS